MAISVAGISFVRPSVSVSTQYATDQNDNILGITDTVSITDTVLATDSSNLISIYSNALSAAFNPADITVSYPGNENVPGRITNVSSASDSDFATKLVYTVTVEATPNRSFSSKYPGVTNRNCKSISFSESVDIPHDSVKVVLNLGEKAEEGEETEEAVFYSKPNSYSCSISVTCGKTAVDAVDNANSIACAMFQQTPTNGILPEQYAGIDVKPFSFSKSVGEEGSVNINFMGYFMPSGAYGMLTAVETLSETDNKIANYKDKSYQLSVTKLGVGASVDCDGITGYGVGGSDEAKSIVDAVLGQFISTSGLSGIESSHPTAGGGETPCVTTLPKFINPDCFKVKTISVDEQKGANSASLNIEATNQNIGNCIDGDDYNSTYNIMIKKRSDQKTIVEVPGWSSPEFWVQDLNVSPDTMYEYTIDVTAKKKCLIGTGIIGEANSIFTSIDQMEGSGIITNKTISVNDNKCSLKITQYSGADQSEDSVGV